MKHLAALLILAMPLICWGDSIPPNILINTSGTITQYDPAKPFISASGNVVGGGTFSFTTTGEKWAHCQCYVTGTLSVYASNFSLVGRLKHIGFPDGPNLLEAWFTGMYVDPSGVRHHVTNYFFTENLDFKSMTVGRGGLAMRLQTPEPGSLWLVASGLMAVAGVARRRLRS